MNTRQRMARPPAARLSLGLVLFSFICMSGLGVAQGQPARISVGNASGAAGAELDLGVVLSAEPSGISALQFDVTLPAALSYIATTSGSAASAAGKQAQGSVEGQRVRVLVFGLNQNIIGGGPVAVIRVSIAPGTAAGELAVTIAEVSASGPDATSVPLSGVDGAVTVVAQGAVCDDGTVELGETCDPSNSCPTSCDDQNACTADQMAGAPEDCNVACSNTPIITCQSGDGCCPVGCGHVEDGDCSVSCGNGDLEDGETCDPPSSCPSDCNDDNACTVDQLTGSAANCNVACSQTPITACASGDGCCPAGCEEGEDADCGDGGADAGVSGDSGGGTRTGGTTLTGGCDCALDGPSASATEPLARFVPLLFLLGLFGATARRRRRRPSGAQRPQTDRTEPEGGR